MTAAFRRMHADRVVTAVGDRRPAILEVVRRAKHRISLSMFRCDDEEILAGLAVAVSRGVAVDVLVTPCAKGGPVRIDELKTALERTGARVHAYPNPIVKYHAKYLVADDGPAIVASLNFTHKCFARTCDALVVTHDTAVVAGLHQLTAADRLGQALPEGLSSRLIVGPERARARFKALIDGARLSVRLIDPKLSDPELLRLLDARRLKGVTVEVHGSNRVGDLKFARKDYAHRRSDRGCGQRRAGRAEPRPSARGRDRSRRTDGGRRHSPLVQNGRAAPSWATRLPWKRRDGRYVT